MVRLVSGPIDKLCPSCPGGLTKMRQLPMTNTWICPECSSTDWYTAAETEQDQWITEE